MSIAKQLLQLTLTPLVLVALAVSPGRASSAAAPAPFALRVAPPAAEPPPATDPAPVAPTVSVPVPAAESAARELFATGKAHLASGAWASAVQAFEQARATGEAVPDLEYQLGVAYFHVGRDAECAALLASATLDSIEARALARYYRGLALARAGRVAEARAQLVRPHLWDAETADPAEDQDAEEPGRAASSADDCNAILEQVPVKRKRRAVAPTSATRAATAATAVASTPAPVAAVPESLTPDTHGTPAILAPAP